jgi:hypothetical protein
VEGVEKRVSDLCFSVLSAFGTVVFRSISTPVTRPKIYENFRKSLHHRGIFGLAEHSREMLTDQTAKWGPHTKGPAQMRCHQDITPQTALRIERSTAVCGVLCFGSRLWLALVTRWGGSFPILGHFVLWSPPFSRCFLSPFHLLALYTC